MNVYSMLLNKNIRINQPMSQTYENGVMVYGQITNTFEKK